MNKIILHGRLTSDPKKSKPYTRNDIERAAYRFTVACDRPRNRDKADFIDCVWFLPTDNNIMKYLTKGKGVVVDGSLQIRSYEDDEGTKRRIAEVLVDNLEFASGKSSGGTSSDSGSDSGSKKPSPPADEEDDDLPF